MHLNFRIIPAPTEKLLRNFRRDAGWTPGERISKKPCDARGRVQWAGIHSGQHLIALARLEIAEPEFCFISDFIVLSKFRGEGVGTVMLNRIEDLCLQLGVRRLILKPDAGTESFYAARQFIPNPTLPEFLNREISPFRARRFSAIAG